MMTHRGMDREQQKLERNRESARMSRKRKKIYIEILENKVAQLHAEVEEANGLLEENNTNLRQICASSNLLSNLIIGRQSIFEKLEEAVATNNEAEASLLLDSLRYRLGANGKERLAGVKFYFRQLAEIFLPLHMKYLLLIAGDDKAEPSLWNQMIEHLELNESQRTVITAYRRRIAEERSAFERCMTDLQHKREELMNKISGFQDVIDDISNSLRPLQIAKFLLILDKHRTSEDFSLGKLFNLPQDQQPELVSPPLELDSPSLPRGLKGDNGTPLIDLNSTLSLFKKTTEFLKKRKHGESE
eukprot:TRINITY_DN4115_c0_g2_i1.p1 TRINITY_DN4115_c0_g2~~TRINITY_DN4115_c0_g2_i1.p1  ORF type:complete len:302 (-),score=65.06 TRINITY_DN4115_c0_g2_i1:740-1645(-)